MSEPRWCAPARPRRRWFGALHCGPAHDDEDIRRTHHPGPFAFNPASSRSRPGRTRRTTSSIRRWLTSASGPASTSINRAATTPIRRAELSSCIGGIPPPLRLGPDVRPRLAPHGFPPACRRRRRCAYGIAPHASAAGQLATEHRIHRFTRSSQRERGLLVQPSHGRQWHGSGIRAHGSLLIDVHVNDGAINQA